MQGICYAIINLIEPILGHHSVLFLRKIRPCHVRCLSPEDLTRLDGIIGYSKEPTPPTDILTPSRNSTPAGEGQKGKTASLGRACSRTSSPGAKNSGFIPICSDSGDPLSHIVSNSLQRRGGKEACKRAGIQASTRPRVSRQLELLPILAWTSSPLVRRHSAERSRKKLNSFRQLTAIIAAMAILIR